MTWFGKILVLFNLALSLTLMTWAMMLFLNRVDWSDQKGKEGRPDGELVRRQEQAKNLWDLIPPAEIAWQSARRTLVDLEEGKPPQRKDGRLANRAWYEAELEHLRTGAAANDPAREVVFDANRRFTPDDKNYGRPQMRQATDLAGKPLTLKSLAAYEQEEKAVFAALEKEQNRLKAGTEEDTRLTEMLLTLPDRPKGLQQRLAEAQVERDRVLSEQDLIKRPLINTQVESELLLNRKRQLEYRLEELKKTRASRLTGLGQKGQ